MNMTHKIETVRLKENKLNIEIYGVEDLNPDFLESIKKHGILTPLTIKEDGTIISGHMRHKAAIKLNIEEVPVNYVNYETELEEREALINFNQQRVKTYSQMANEADSLKDIEAKKAEQRKLNGLKNTDTQTFAEHEKGESKQIIAKKTGFGSKENLRKYEKVREAAQNGSEKASTNIKKLDSGDITINKAYKDLRTEEKKKENEQKIKEFASKPLNGNIKLLEGDLFEQIKNVEDNSIDLLCTDPPYMVLNEDWDTFKTKEDFLRFTEDWLNAVMPKVKQTGKVFISFATKFKFDLYNILAKNNFYDFIFGDEVIWVKRNNNKRNSKKTFRYQYESILYLYGKEAPDLNFEDYGEIQSNVWEIATPQSNFNEGKYHPAQKPLELYRRIIQVGSNENDLVLDCFGGSGTTGIVCKKSNRDCVLIERDKKYIELIKGRLNQ